MKEPELDMDKPPTKRAKSFNVSRDNGPELNVKSRTAAPSLLTRWKRATMRGRVMGGSEDSEETITTPVDDLICLDSFEDRTFGEEPRIVVTKESIRYDLLDLLKGSGSQTDILGDLETRSKLTVQNAEMYFRGLSHFERNVAYLAATFFNRHDLMESLFATDVDINFYEPKLGCGGLHIAAFSGAVDICDFLIAKGININAVHSSFTPLHFSALGGSLPAARRLLLAGAVINKVMPGMESVLHSAVRARSVECVQLFIESGLDVNVTDSCGMTAFHLAADLGDVQSLRVMLDCGTCEVDRPTRVEQNTALHLAATGGTAEAVKLLLDRGAKPNLVNATMKTPLHLSSRVCMESTLALLKKGADPNAADNDNRTPLHTAVSRSEVRFGPEITSLLLSWKADPNKRDRYGYTPLHIAALNELPDCVENLISYKADVSAKTRGGTVALALIARKTPTALAALHQQLDSCISGTDPEVNYREVKLSYNFKYLLQGCERGEMNFLQTFVNEGQRNLLEHPLCEAFLHLKWQKIRKYYALRLIFCFILVSLLSMYVLTVLAYQCYKQPEPEPRPGEITITSRFNLIEVDKSLCSNKSSFGAWLREHPRIVESQWLVLAAVTIFEILRKVYGFNGYKSLKDYLTLSNIVEWFVIIAVFATSFIYTGKTHVWQNHVGAFAVLFGWTNLMVMIGHLPMFGSYVAMYTRVQKEFAKLLSAYICVLIGFTFCFCAIFVKAEEFDNPFVGFVKILVMMVGELEFGELLKNIGREQDSSELLLQISALITFVLFLLFVTIILINLLIGIAVHDIQGLKKTAGLSKLVGLTNLMSHIESALFGNRLPACFIKILNSSVRIPRAVLIVKPLNPQEKRLPKEIMRAGLDITRQCAGDKDRKMRTRKLTFRKKRDSLSEGAVQEIMDAILSLSGEIGELRQMLNSVSKR